jgi:hypothetical protein
MQTEPRAGGLRRRENFLWRTIESNGAQSRRTANLYPRPATHAPNPAALNFTSSHPFATRDGAYSPRGLGQHDHGRVFFDRIIKRSQNWGPRTIQIHIFTINTESSCSALREILHVFRSVKHISRRLMLGAIKLGVVQ